MHPYSLQSDQYEHHLDSQDELSVIRSVSGHILWNIQRISPKRQTDINNINGLALLKEPPNHYLEENNSNFTPILHHAKLNLDTNKLFKGRMGRQKIQIRRATFVDTIFKIRNTTYVGQK